VSLFGRAKSKLGRGGSLSARPHPAPVVGAKERPDGGLIVTIRVDRPRWQRLLGASERTERSFGLDAYGREVLEACDGRRSVKAIVRRFAKAHQMSLAEAELAVATFLKTLVSKGLVAMEIRDPGKRRRA